MKNTLLPTLTRFLDDDWDSLFDWNNRHFSNTSTTLPAVNIHEESDAYIVEMAAPGMKKEDFEIELNDNVLTIKSELKHQNEEKEGERSLRREFSYQSFQRSFNINQQIINESDIQASYEEGILRLRLAKREEAKEKPARLIEVQ